MCTRPYPPIIPAHNTRPIPTSAPTHAQGTVGHVQCQPGIRDLAFLVGSSVEPADRAEHEESLVMAYHAALAKRGVEYTWEQCWSDYVFIKVTGMQSSGAWLISRTHVSHERHDHIPLPPPYSPTHLPYRPPAVVGFISAKQFEHKAGAFAEEAEKSDLVLEATKRWDAYVGRVAADLKHHSWASILGALPEDGS